MKHGIRIFLLIFALALVFPVAANAEGNYGYDKGFFIKSDDGNFSNTTYGWGLMGWQMVINDPGDNTNQFQLNEFRVGWFGNVFSKNIEYRISYSLAANQLVDGYANFIYDEMLALRAGQFKVPYNYESLVVDNSLNMFSRSMVDGKFTFERGIGAMLYGILFDDMLEYYVGAFNARDLNAVAPVYPMVASGRLAGNPGQEFMYALRLMAHLMGNVGYTMGDLKNSETPNISFGLGFNYNTVTIAPLAVFDDYMMRIAPDVNVRYMGFSLLAEFHYQKIKNVNADFGFTGILGYFLLPEMVELAARYSGFYSDTVADEYEFGGTLNYYVYGHQVKAMVEYIYHKFDVAGGPKDHTITLGAQVGFF